MAENNDELHGLTFKPREKNGHGDVTDSAGPKPNPDSTESDLQKHENEPTSNVNQDPEKPLNNQKNSITFTDPGADDGEVLQELGKEYMALVAKDESKIFKIFSQNRKRISELKKEISGIKETNMSHKDVREEFFQYSSKAVGSAEESMGTRRYKQKLALLTVCALILAGVFIFLNPLDYIILSIESIAGADEETLAQVVMSNKSDFDSKIFLFDMAYVGWNVGSNEAHLTLDTLSKDGLPGPLYIPLDNIDKIHKRIGSEDSPRSVAVRYTADGEVDSVGFNLPPHEMWRVATYIVHDHWLNPGWAGAGLAIILIALFITRRRRRGFE